MSWQVTSGIFWAQDPDRELEQAMDAFGLCPEKSQDVRFDFPVQGISFIRISEDCRVAIHTWPEHSLATVDVYSQASIRLSMVLAQVGWREVPCRSELPLYSRLLDGRRFAGQETEILVSSARERHILVADTPVLGRVLLLDHRLSLALSDQQHFFAALACLLNPLTQSVVLNSAVLLPLVPELIRRGVAEVAIVDANKELCFVLRNWFGDALSEDWRSCTNWQHKSLSECTQLSTADAVICVDPIWTSDSEVPQWLSAEQQLICSVGFSAAGNSAVAQRKLAELRAAYPAGSSVSIERPSLNGQVIFFSSCPDYHSHPDIRACSFFEQLD